MVLIRNGWYGNFKLLFEIIFVVLLVMMKNLILKSKLRLLPYIVARSKAVSPELVEFHYLGIFTGGCHSLFCISGVVIFGNGIAV